MRISSVRDLGFYIKDRRRRVGMTQGDLCAAAGVSRRWLSDLEAGKATAEIGLAFKVLHALELTVDVVSSKPPAGAIDLDDVLRDLNRKAGDPS